MDQVKGEYFFLLRKCIKIRHWNFLSAIFYKVIQIFKEIGFNRQTFRALEKFFPVKKSNESQSKQANLDSKKVFCIMSQEFPLTNLFSFQTRKLLRVPNSLQGHRALRSLPPSDRRIRILRQAGNLAPDRHLPAVPDPRLPRGQDRGGLALRPVGVDGARRRLRQGQR